MAQPSQGLGRETGLVGVACARAVLPLPGVRDHVTRRIMPFIMVGLAVKSGIEVYSECECLVAS